MPKRKQPLLNDLYQFFIAVPWWVGPVLAAVVFGVLCFLAPQAMPAPEAQDSTSTVMSKTLLQVVAPLPAKLAPWVAGLILLVWAGSLVGKLSRRNLVETTQGIEDLRSLTWRDFELLVGEYYRRNGFSVEERGGASSDGGVDIALRKGGRLALVQCKHWKTQRVGVRQVRELLGAMSHEKADSGIFITAGGFTADACTLAKQNRIELVDGEALLRMVESARQTPATDPPPVQTAETTPSRTPSCPRCGSPMTLRTAQKGPNAGSRFYGCSKYPKCNGKRDFSRKVHSRLTKGET